MKKVSFLLFVLIGFISLNSCTEDDSFTFVAKPDPVGLAFTSLMADNYNLKASNGEGLAERFVWNAVDFDVPAPVNYELQGSPSESFESLDIVSEGTQTNGAVTVSQMLSLANDAGLDNDPETDEPNTGTLYFKVRAYVGDGANTVEQFSEVVSVNVTLPEAAEEGEPAKMDLFLVGDATPTGWDNTATSNNYPLFRDSANANIYYYTGKFTAGGVKVIEQRGAWAPQYGGENGSLIYRATEADPDPSPVTVDSEGYYTFTINIEEMTYSLEPYDASAATVYDQIGLVGAGTTVGWPGNDNPTPDILLTQSSVDPHIWYTKDVELSEDGIKFRANLAWDVNWGGGENFPSGQATGDDIIVSSAGAYNVWFNDLTGRYIFIPVGEE